MQTDEIKSTFCLICAVVTFLSLVITCFALMDSKTQYSENIVIIEQLCNLDKTSYWCRRIK